jgi:hypothetical protein
LAAVAVCAFGAIVIAVRGSGEPVGATVRVAVPIAPVPSALVNVAVMVDVPEPAVVASPLVALIVATVPVLEAHLSCCG